MPISLFSLLVVYAFSHYQTIIETKLFYFFINDMANFQKLFRWSGMHEMGALPYRGTTEGPQTWEKCVHQNTMKQHKGGYQCPVTGEEQHRALIHASGQLAKNQVCREGTGVLVNNLTMKYQCGLAAKTSKSTLECITKSTATFSPP